MTEKQLLKLINKIEDALQNTKWEYEGKSFEVEMKQRLERLKQLYEDLYKIV
jgi:archaellum component FlaC